MSIENTGKNVLEKAVSSYTKNQKFHICIHDTSGILHKNPDLNLPIHFCVHSGTFCQTAKITPMGIRFCLRCKAASLRKASSYKMPYAGQCYLGLTEIVRPVVIQERLVCVIYLGNILVEEQKSEVYRRIERMSNITGADVSVLKESLKDAHVIKEKDIELYDEMLDVLEYLIKSGGAQYGVHKKNASNSPMYYGTNHWAINSIRNYVMEFYNRDLKLPQLAKLYFLNADYLCRLFRKETGLSFSEYINKIRIAEAKKLLEMTEEDIMNISLQVGFHNVTYFNRQFKMQTGVTPREYRQMKGRMRID